jgi:drug/metabolite transporter (DMT)-like permease
MVVPAGGVLLAAGQEPVPLTAGAWVTLAGVLALGVVSYWAITAATRGGDIAFVAPFRYTRLVFALAVAWAMFGEVPDGWTLAGAALIVASGLYTFARERQLSLRAQSDYEGRGSNGARS